MASADSAGAFLTCRGIGGHPESRIRQQEVGFAEGLRVAGSEQRTAARALSEDRRRAAAVRVLPKASFCREESSPIVSLALYIRLFIQ